MNQALVNAPHALLPAYDAGVALEWQAGDIALRGRLHEHRRER